MPGRNRVVVLHERRHIDAVLSPARQEILTVFGELGPSAVKEVAARLGRSPHSVYPHVRKLVATGVLGVAETRRVGRRDESIYRIIGSRIVLAPKGKAARGARERGAAALLRLARREVAAELRRGAGDESDRAGRKELVVLRAAGRLSDAHLDEIHRMIERVQEILRAARRTECDRPVRAVTIVLSRTRRDR